jgi:HSP20 family protein
MSDPNPENSSIPPVERMRQEVDRWLEAVRSTGERTLETLGLTGANRPATPPVDVIELPEEILVQIDLPGVSAESVELSLVGNMLTIAAIRILPEFPGEARFHVRERAVGRFQRSVPLPAAVNDEAIRAETRDGLLTVTLRKAMPTVGRSIPVSRGNGT